MRKIKVWRDPYGEGFNTTRRKEIEFSPGLTVLVGCNGAGKSTLIKNIEQELKNDKIPVLLIDNSSGSGRKETMSVSSFNEDFATLATAMCSSEGENITITLHRLMSEVRSFIYSGQKTISRIARAFGAREEEITSKERWILFDGIDSGYSIDNVVTLKSVFSYMMEDAKKYGNELYIIASANEYELANGERCLDVMEGVHKTFKDYEDFKKFIIRSSEKKEKRC